VGLTTTLLCLAAIAESAAEPSPLPEIEPLAIEVDVTSLPASEQAALVPILFVSQRPRPASGDFEQQLPSIRPQMNTAEQAESGQRFVSATNVIFHSTRILRH
jgi:hypothetical protein